MMMRIPSLVAAGLSVMLAVPVFAQQAGSGPAPDYAYRHMHMWHGGMFFGPLLWVLVLCAIAAIVARIFGWGRHGYYHRRMGGALDILEERFARGEIDKTEFEERRKLLSR